MHGIAHDAKPQFHGLTMVVVGQTGEAGVCVRCETLYASAMLPGTILRID